MKFYLIFLFTSLILTSCIPDENPVKPYDRGGILSNHYSLGNNYTTQAFFSLDKNLFYNGNDIYIWDLAFACQDSNHTIILNFTKAMKLADLGFREFDEVNQSDADKINEEKWLRDMPSGNPDSTAFGKWWDVLGGQITTLGKVYIVDRGINELGKKLGFVKFQIIDYNTKEYKIIFANLKDNIKYELKITKDNKYNYIYLSLNQSGKILQIEPFKNEWDLLFSKYTELLYDNTGAAYWYSVVGAYLNPNGAEGIMLKNTEYESIDSRILDTIKLSKNRNIIGHDWKYYDLNASLYKIIPKTVMIVKSVSGFYYKMRFIGFYDDEGNKGNPIFEFQKL